MMAQYLEIKTANPGYLLFYRMGDFYELFFEDAQIASRALGIALTKRGKHLGDDIPMCGVPVHAADDYLQRLIGHGHRVAVCEQTEDPAEAKKRGSKAVVRRDVVRLVTRGTLTEDNLLDPRRNNYLAALFRAPASEDRASFALAALDISTGDCSIAMVAEQDLAGELTGLSPSELLVSEAQINDHELDERLRHCGATLTARPAQDFDSAKGRTALRTALGVAALEPFGDFTRPELAAMGAVLAYVALTQIGQQPTIRPPRRSGPNDVMVIDAATRANLELTCSLQGDRSASLLSAIDRTRTGSGGRLLSAWLARPLTSPEEINGRLDAVSALSENASVTDRLMRELTGTPDMPRALARLSLSRGGPRDLGTIRAGLERAAALGRHLSEARDLAGLPDLLVDVRERLIRAHGPLLEHLGAALGEELPAHVRDGGFVRRGYRGDLEDARALRDESRKVIAGLQAGYAEATGVKSLKVRHNNVLGYFVEVTAANAGALTAAPHNMLFHHRQTMANAMRFSTPELAETEARIAMAAETALAIEEEVFDALVADIMGSEDVIAGAAEALAELDVVSALAALASAEGWVRPKVDGSRNFEIRDGRHPVVEGALAGAGGDPFIANDCWLDAGEGADGAAPTPSRGARILVVTGPNMAGKSTFLRQNAVIAILAQMGSFVPARSAHVGVVDRVFSRIGASDDLSRGRSTFMVEMVETATILNQATDRSIVILDEIGRGTATFDGLSIAWAALEHLHDVNRCRALFATHYHELTALAERLTSAANATMAVKEWRDDIVFLHKVEAGAANRSYGLQVAKLAGLPHSVLVRAAEVLKRLESSESNRTGADIIDELPLFSARPDRAPAHPSGPSPVDVALAGLNPDDMTPREAMDALFELKALLERSR